jgi:predicted nuclease of restriction endonuclease-like (RecB) superfamily
MASDLTINKEYKNWLTEIKLKIRNVQIKAAVKVNIELLHFYWELGADIVVKQATAKWGDGFLPQLSRDLMAEFPEMKGFSLSNLKYIKQWYLFYRQNNAISQQAVGQVTGIPWGHNIAIVTKCKDVNEALYYVQNTMVHNWSRSILKRRGCCRSAISLPASFRALYPATVCFHSICELALSLRQHKLAKPRPGRWHISAHRQGAKTLLKARLAKSSLRQQCVTG